MGDVGDSPSTGDAGEPVDDGRVEWRIMFTLGEAQSWASSLLNQASVSGHLLAFPPPQIVAE